MRSFRALIGPVVRLQNVICDTPTSLGAREQPDNLILTRLATNAGHRAMSNLHSTIYNPTVIYNPIHPIYTPNMISSSALARYQS